ncbi:MAG: hypothetical protein EP330_16775 [Deltaproteobacteria bacterium]|nr:MAG: hypothetical protein EP330_16775 [Deltaproteobacteria bacterium]
MGLFDIFLSEDKLIAKHARTITNRDAQEEDREASVRWLANQGSERAILGLLARFDMALEHQLKDKGEKDFTYDVLLSLGDKAVGPTEAFVRRSKQVAWPLRLHTALTSEARSLELVYELLAAEVAKNDFKPARKKALLLWLTERTDSGAIAAATPLLEDFDEGVRYAAAEVILGQNDAAGREPLLSVLDNPEEDSNRLKLRIADVFAQRRWSVEGASPERLALLNGYAVQDDRLIAAQ